MCRRATAEHDGEELGREEIGPLRSAPRSGGATSGAGLSSRTRSERFFERRASANILLATPQTLRAVVQRKRFRLPVRSAARFASTTTSSSFCTMSSRSRFCTDAIGFVPIMGAIHWSSCICRRSSAVSLLCETFVSSVRTSPAIASSS